MTAPAHKEVTAAMGNKEADMVTRDMVDIKVVNKDMVDMVNRNLETTVDKATADSKADGNIKASKVMVNNVVMDNQADRDTKDNKKVVGGNKKIMVNSADLEKNNTGDMDSYMRASTVKTATMAEEDMAMMKMNPGCRDVTRVGEKKKIMMTILMKMKMMTIMECRAGMEKETKMNMIRKTAAGKPLCDIHVVGLAACPTSRMIAGVAKIGIISAWEGRANRAVLQNMDQSMDLMVPLLRAGVLADQAVAATTLPVAVPPECRAVWAGNHRMGALVAVAGVAAPIRAAHRNTEAVVHPVVPLPATAVKADQVTGARVQVEIEVVPGKDQSIYKT